MTIVNADNTSQNRIIELVDNGHSDAYAHGAARAEQAGVRPLPEHGVDAPSVVESRIVEPGA